MSGATKTPEPTLRSAELKIQRAWFHYECLAEAFGELREPGALVFVPEVEDNGRRHVYRAKNPPSVDERWSGMVGDCIHNLRAALDHLAYQLVIANGGRPTDQTSFPIRDHLPGHKKPGPCRVSGGVAPAALKLIERVQPYNGTESREFLSVLKALDNFVKHRELAVVIAAVHQARSTWTLDQPDPGMTSATFTGKPLIDGEVVAWFTYDPPRAEPDPGLTLMPFIKLADGMPGERRLVQPLLVRLKTIIQDELLPQFFPFVPPGPHRPPAGGKAVAPGRRSSGSAFVYNYFVTFVDGETGASLESGSGYDPALPSMPVFAGG